MYIMMMTIKLGVVMPKVILYLPMESVVLTNLLQMMVSVVILKVL